MSRAGEILEKFGDIARRVLTYRGGYPHKITKCPPGDKVMGQNHCIPMATAERIIRSKAAKYRHLKNINNQRAISRDRALSMSRREHAGY